MSAGYEPTSFETVLDEAAMKLILAATGEGPELPRELLDDMTIQQVRAVRATLVTEQNRITRLAAAIGQAHTAISNAVRAPGTR